MIENHSNFRRNIWRDFSKGTTRKRDMVAQKLVEQNVAKFWCE